MVAAAILAGGRGRRMSQLGSSGIPTATVVKPFLVVDGSRIIDRQLAVLRPLFNAVVVVAADHATFDAAALGVGVITDRRGPGLGPLAGLEAALAWLPAGFDACVCVAGDMPFLAPGLIQHLRDVPPAAASAVVPLVAGQLQPLCARYHRGLASRVASALDGGTRAMHAFLEHAAAHAAGTPEFLVLNDDELRRHDPALDTFINVNRPDDVAAASALR